MEKKEEKCEWPGCQNEGIWSIIITGIRWEKRNGLDAPVLCTAHMKESHKTEFDTLYNMFWKDWKKE